MKYLIETIHNGVLITSTRQNEHIGLEAPSTIFCRDIYVATEVLATWELNGHVKAAAKAQKLNMGP